MVIQHASFFSLSGTLSQQCKGTSSCVCVLLGTEGGCCACWASTPPLGHVPIQHSLSVCLHVCAGAHIYTCACRVQRSLVSSICIHVCADAHIYSCAYRGQRSSVSSVCVHVCVGAQIHMCAYGGQRSVVSSITLHSVFLNLDLPEDGVH